MDGGARSFLRPEVTPVCGSSTYPDRLESLSYLEAAGKGRPIFLMMVFLARARVVC